MKNNKKIVRNMAVFCALSKLENTSMEIDFGDQHEKRLLYSTIEYILSNVFEEQANYQTLLYNYYDAFQGNENTYFSYAVFCDKKHAIRIDKDGKILLYFYQDKIQIGIPWDYPHLITHIGTVDDNVNFCSVLNDLKKLSTLDFLLKYYIRNAENMNCINSISEGYLVNGFLKIIVNEHIIFTWIDSYHNHQEKYIADSWWTTKEDIIKDLTNTSLIKFGKKYIGFWGR